MSYLDFPRITFAGSFHANPSTINNAAINYYAYIKPDPFMQGSPTQSSATFNNPKNFPKKYKKYVSGPSWNPTGLAHFQFGGTVRSFFGPEGSLLEELEGAMLSTIIKPKSSVGKLVDLDTNQQTLTQLFGLVVQLALQDGTVVFTAQMSQAAMEANQLPVLTDLWFAKISAFASDSGASGTFQWILDDITWYQHDQHASLAPAVAALKEHYAQGISIKINVDRYNANPPSLAEPAAHHGRVVGTLGPARAGEPFSFVVGRRFEPSKGSPYWVGSFVLGDDNVLTLDLGNSIPTQPDGTPLNLDQRFVAGTQSDVDTPQPFVNGQNIPVTRYWYETFAGIVSVALTSDEAERLKNGSLYLWLEAELFTNSRYQAVLQENDHGWFVKPELSTSRMSAGDTLKIKFWTIHRGVLSDYTPHLTLLKLPASAMGQPGNPPLILNGSGKPSDGLTIGKFKKETVDGKTEVGIGFIEVTANTITIHDKLPTFRKWAGSQVYFLGGDWLTMGLPINSNISNGFTILLWVKKDLPENPKWKDVKKLLGGYAAIYPGMRGKLNIGKQAIVDQPENAQIMRTLMSLPVYDPSYMPVTRDMSPADSQLVIRYLDDQIP